MGDSAEVKVSFGVACCRNPGGAEPFNVARFRDYYRVVDELYLYRDSQGMMQLRQLRCVSC